MWPTGLLDWRMKPDITDVDSRSQGNSERLNGAMKVLVIERVYRSARRQLMGW